MRHLLQPSVLGLATAAGALSALACYPDLSLWRQRPAPLWYLEAVIFPCCIILWGFVFAWHRPHGGKPPVAFKQSRGTLLAATALALAVALVFHFWLDPALRSRFPQDYPLDFTHWLAALLFDLGLVQLLCLFAPFDWLLRLTRKPWLAMVLTAAWIVCIQALRLHTLVAPVSPALGAAILAARMAGALLAVAFYARGGVVLIWWWALVVHSRLLWDFPVGS